MSNLTLHALNGSRLTLFSALLILLAGVATFLGFPTQEEPSVTIRDALVSIQFPGLPSERVEELLARPTEEKLRELPQIKTIVTTIHPGSVVIQVTARDDIKDLGVLWQQVRNKASEAGAGFPPGTQGPFVDDNFGRVAVASIAVTAPGYSMSEMRGPLKRLRDQLGGLPGIGQVTLHGVQEQQLSIDFNPQRLAGLGLSPQQLFQQLQQQNVLAPGGVAEIGGQSTTLTVTGELLGVEQLRQLPIQLPGAAGSTRSVALGTIAQVSVMAVDPPQTAAIYQGQDAVVLAVSMAAGQNIQQFGAALRSRLAQLEQQLPLGFATHVVTFQADVVAQQMSKMKHVMIETVVIVMAVVMLFLGWRTGLVVGAIVPLTILGTLIAMRLLGVELQTVSMAAIILALGLLVDNGIVIAEDIERRLHAGEVRRQACVEAGRTLAIPLLTSSLVIVLAFSPFFLGQTSTNEYLRSLAIVLALTLLGSWLLSITVTPLLCLYFSRAAHDEAADEAYDSGFYRGYRAVIGRVLRHKLLFLMAMLVLLAAAVFELMRVPYDFLPPSDRLQFQVPITLEPGSGSRNTLQSVREISLWLSKEPAVVDSIGYVGDGGPRIVLGLNPPLPAPETAYFTVSVKAGSDIDAVIANVRRYLLKQHPELRAEPKRFSLGTTEAGVAIYRIIGPDENVLRTLAAQIEAALRQVPGTLDVRNDWSTRLTRYTVEVDQPGARRAGVDTQAIAQALQLHFGGLQVSSLQDGETRVPLVVREPAPVGGAAPDLRGILVYPADGSTPVPLTAIAQIRASSEPSTLVRRNQERAITVVGQNPGLTATSLVERLAPQVAALRLPPGYRIELGGEIEDSAEANQALLQYLPHALVAMLLLFVWQFNSLRKVLIVVSAIPFVLIGVAVALLITGYPFGFMATFGLLSLAGIIVNNAVLLLERIEAELHDGLAVHDAVVNAAVKRLRPIVMTKLTCIIGLVPLMLFAGPLWEGMAITLMGGLALGTLVTLGLIPVLYVALFTQRSIPTTETTTR